MTQLAAILVLAGLLVWQAREHAKATEAWRRERSQLLNRIKPETAVPDEGPAPVSLQAIPYDDDEAFWRSRGIDVSEVR